MEHLFWLFPGELCGRPGPNHQPWQAETLRAAGVGAVLSVNDGESVYADDFTRLGMTHRCVPLARNAPPRDGDLELCRERLPLAYAWARGEIEAARPVLVHCRQGKDRTGLFMAYYLMARNGLDRDSAIARVMQLRPIALTATGWDRFAPQVLDACAADIADSTGRSTLQVPVPPSLTFCAELIYWQAFVVDDSVTGGLPLCYTGAEQWILGR